MFSRDFGRQERAKIKHILESGRNEGARWWAFVPAFIVSTGACGGRAALAILLTLAKMDKIPSFCPLYCFALVAMPLKYAFIRILRAFIRVYGLLVWVCSSWVLCVACRAFVCVSG